MVGPIVGGVIGGVAVLAFLAVAGIVIKHRNRKDAL